MTIQQGGRYPRIGVMASDAVEQEARGIIDDQFFDPSRPSDSLVDVVLGPAIDLLVWILKVIGDIAVGCQRPLKIPPCGRRLFGAASMRVLGPGIEPHLSPAQLKQLVS